jgi:hypothetical protein
MTQTMRQAVRDESWRIASLDSIDNIRHYVHMDDLGDTIVAPTGLAIGLLARHGVTLDASDGPEADAIFRSAVRRRLAVHVGF